MSAQRKRGLGRSLNVLLSSDSNQDGDNDTASSQREIAIERLAPGEHQPRRHFDEESLHELSQSISAQGVIQPIVARALGGERYEIIAGERRWRAAQMAGLKSVPAVVRVLDKRGAMAIALVENIQRADLNPLEEAEALGRLLDECQLTHEQVAEAVGKSRATVSNLLRLTELNEDVQMLLRTSKLSLGHAKVLLGAEGARQSSLAKMVAEQQLSVRQTEALVKAEPSRPSKVPVPVNSENAALEQSLREKLGVPVSIQQNAKGKGKLTIRYKNAAELEALLSRFGE
tara:strand:+ start:2260 stop:3120 length:861 start_codon:yes stop_codon:yes gene_type:complete